MLTVLSVLLKKAMEWNVIDCLPCTIKVLQVSKGSTRFYDFDEFERLVAAAVTVDPRVTCSCCWRPKPGYGRRNGGAGMGRHRFRQGSTVRATVGMERASRVTKRRPAAVHPDDRTARRCPSRRIDTFAGHECCIRMTDCR